MPCMLFFDFRFFVFTGYVVQEGWRSDELALKIFFFFFP